MQLAKEIGVAALIIGLVPLWVPILMLMAALAWWVDEGWRRPAEPAGTCEKVG